MHLLSRPPCLIDTCEFDEGRAECNWELIISGIFGRIEPGRQFELRRLGPLGVFATLVDLLLESLLLFVEISFGTLVIVNDKCFSLLVLQPILLSPIHPLRPRNFNV